MPPIPHRLRSLSVRNKAVAVIPRRSACIVRKGAAVVLRDLTPSSGAVSRLAARVQVWPSLS